MEIALISDSYPPKKDATSRLNYEIVSFLSHQANVSVITCADGNQTSYIKDELNISGKIRKVRRIPVIFNQTRLVFLKPLRYLNYVIGIVLYLFLKKQRRQLYIIHSSPPLAIPIFALLLWLSKRFALSGKRSILIVHDLYPDILYSALKLDFRASLFPFNILTYVMSSVFNQYDRIVCCSSGIQQRICTDYNIDSSRVISLYNWSVDEQQSLRVQMHANKTIQFMWVGNIGPLHLTPHVHYVVRALATRSHPYLFKFYASGRDSQKLKKSLVDLNSVQWEPYATPDVLRDQYQLHSCITLVSLPSDVCACAMPSRISYALALGSPIVYITDLADHNILSELILDNGLGVTITAAMTASEMTSAIQPIIDNFSTYSITCRNFYKDNMTFEKWRDEFLKLIDQIS
jgi:glycosyltransferase involved in cell wall biosynthesis